MHPIEQFAYEFNVQHDYFECHEVLEELWQAGQRQDESLVALIQLAVARYHHRRGNSAGAMRTYPKAFQKLEYHAGSLSTQGIDVHRLLALQPVFMQTDYEHIPLPLTPDLEQQINNLPIERLQDLSFLRHKHVLRDRQDVITARQIALTARQKK
ncbi:DUF309 domain-containing protein [Exiguobacterium sp. S22-S28]|uniref:DUF309 domain-containing protein n=1 Tax=Exiguobacterium sp. S22-S28 TaxID=3342768 RepID=UPI00372CF118